MWEDCGDDARVDTVVDTSCGAVIEELDDEGSPAPPPWTICLSLHCSSGLWLWVPGGKVGVTDAGSDGVTERDGSVSATLVTGR